MGLVCTLTSVRALWSTLLAAAVSAALIAPATPASAVTATGLPPEPIIESSFHAPKLTERDLRLPLLLSVGTAIAWRYEDEDATVRMLDRSGLQDALDWGDMYGDGRVLGGTALGLYSLGKLTNHEGTAATGMDLIQSLGLTWVTVWVLKVSINAERPDGGPYSFPSGHTATAFAGAPVFAAHYGNGVGAAAYGAAILTGFGRVEERRHRLADIVFGAAVGIFMGREAVGFSQKEERHLRVDGDGVHLGFVF